MVEANEVRLRWRDCFKIAASQLLFNIFLIVVAIIFLAALGAAVGPPRW